MIIPTFVAPCKQPTKGSGQRGQACSAGAQPPQYSTSCQGHQGGGRSMQRQCRAAAAKCDMVGHKPHQDKTAKRRQHRRAKLRTHACVINMGRHRSTPCWRIAKRLASCLTMDGLARLGARQIGTESARVHALQSSLQRLQWGLQPAQTRTPLITWKETGWRPCGNGGQMQITLRQGHAGATRQHGSCQAARTPCRSGSGSESGRVGGMQAGSMAHVCTYHSRSASPSPACNLQAAGAIVRRIVGTYAPVARTSGCICHSHTRQAAILPWRIIVLH